MTERPILFSGQMIRAILAGTKTQTRRAVKLGFTDWQRDHSLAMMVTGSDGMPCFTDAKAEPSPAMMAMLRSTPGKPCPYGVAGDSLWVRETWAPADAMYQLHENDEPSVVAYRADKSAIQFDAVTPRAIPAYDLASWNWDSIKWKPSIFLPRWASRITLPVTAVRVERLQDISEADAIAEGVEQLPGLQGLELPPFIKRWRDYMPEREGVGGGVASARESFFTLWESINGTASLAANPWTWALSFGPAQIGGAK